MRKEMTGTDGLSRAVTTRQAAERLSISEGMVWKLLRERAIGSFQVGRARRIPVVELDRYVARNLRKAS